MNHLSPDELIDAMEGLLGADRQSHLAVCDDCRRALDELSAVLGDARQVSVPEPSPLFWGYFSERVRTAIDNEPAAWPSWLRWQVLAPLGAMAMVVLGLMIAVPKSDPSDANHIALDAPALEPLGAIDNWVMVEDLVGDMDLDTAAATGVIEPGVAEQAVLQLTTEEQRELTRLLRAELNRVKS
jgi:hypothetical protein